MKNLNNNMNTWKKSYHNQATGKGFFYASSDYRIRIGAVEYVLEMGDEKKITYASSLPQLKYEYKQFDTHLLNVKAKQYIQKRIYEISTFKTDTFLIFNVRHLLVFEFGEIYLLNYKVGSENKNVKWIKIDKCPLYWLLMSHILKWCATRRLSYAWNDNSTVFFRSKNIS